MLREALAAREAIIERLANAAATQWSADAERMRRMLTAGFAGFARMDNSTLIGWAKALGVEARDLEPVLQPTLWDKELESSRPHRLDTAAPAA